MAEINEVIERVRSDLNYAVDITRDKDVKFPIHAGDATKLLDELETVRAQRDELRVALTDIGDIAQLNLDTTVDRHAMVTIRNVATAVNEAYTALNTQPAPQAEWTPRKLIVTFDDRYSYPVIQTAAKHIDDFVGTSHAMSYTATETIGTWEMPQEIEREAIASLMYAVREVDMYRFEPEWSDESDD